jgi:tetratricopeptide (TPR) repeat protein
MAKPSAWLMAAFRNRSVGAWLTLVVAATASASGLPATAAAQGADDWSVVRDPFDKSVIARYKAILAKNPHDAGALAKLLEMYRRYRTVDLLRSEYRKLADANNANATAVLARIDKSTGDATRALATFQTAATLLPKDGEIWAQIGELLKASDAAGSRRAYDQALATNRRSVKKTGIAFTC